MIVDRGDDCSFREVESCSQVLPTDMLVFGEQIGRGTRLGVMMMMVMTRYW